jgi:hypothetical protein
VLYDDSFAVGMDDVDHNSELGSPLFRAIGEFVAIVVERIDTVGPASIPGP